MVSAFEPQVPKSSWVDFESRLVVNTRRVLSILEEFQVRGTFFTLGWVGEHFPVLVQEIQKRGHEVACHGYDHRLIYHQTPDEFRQDVRRAKQVLEQACGVPVRGYRAPSFSIVKDTTWALAVLAEEGFRYDASVLPAAHSRGGLRGAPRHPYRVNGLTEVPLSTLRLLGRNFPFSGGGYFRLFPEWLIHHGFRSCNAKGVPVVSYLHPWEFDPTQPRLRGGRLGNFKHYVNLDQTESKFRQLLRSFRFGTVQEALASFKGWSNR